jgi:hypothetical protein
MQANRLISISKDWWLLIMKNWQYTLYLFILGVISFITKEVVTFVMLGIILVALNNIHSTLLEILKNQKK